MCMSVLAACMSVHIRELEAPEGQKKDSDPAELESGGCEPHVGAVNQTQVLCKRNKCSSLLSHPRSSTVAVSHHGIQTWA